MSTIVSVETCTPISNSTKPSTMRPRNPRPRRASGASSATLEAPVALAHGPQPRFVRRCRLAQRSHRQIDACHRARFDVHGPRQRRLSLRLALVPDLQGVVASRRIEPRAATGVGLREVRGVEHHHVADHRFVDRAAVLDHPGCVELQRMRGRAVVQRKRERTRGRKGIQRVTAPVVTGEAHRAAGHDRQYPRRKTVTRQRHVRMSRAHGCAGGRRMQAHHRTVECRAVRHAFHFDRPRRCRAVHCTERERAQDPQSDPAGSPVPRDHSPDSPCATARGRAGTFQQNRPVRATQIASCRAHARGCPRSSNAANGTCGFNTAPQDRKMDAHRRWPVFLFPRSARSAGDPMRCSVLTLFACSTLASATTFAAEDGWHGTGELGVAISKGNADSETVVGKLKLAREDDTWKHAVLASFLYGTSDGLENARRYELFGSSGYRFAERHYVFGSGRNQRDHFSSDEYQTTIAGGYGFEALMSEETKLVFEIGPGYRWSKEQDVRVHNNEAIARAFMDFSHQLTQTTQLYDTLLIESGGDNTFVRNEFGVQVKMTDALALKAGFEIRHNTDVAPDRERTDRLTTVNVVYGF
ncbi:DUF481 domain-containing protein [Luteimonas terrae]|uniref:DUF481 domain-containing protein n=2 Tax=Luteimonas terrae TaxID=1530191 RepID=A0A4R5UCA8_9GAMM|nr:DUF481 domain-containing protein [Luteimonas terrae]